MDLNVLNEIMLAIRAATLGWEHVLEPILLNVVNVHIMLAMTLMSASLLFRTSLFGVAEHLLQFLLLSGFSVFLVTHSSEMVTQLFEGTKQLSTFLNGQPLDVAAVVSQGVVIAQILLTSIADQGIYNFLTSPLLWVTLLAALFLLLAYVMLAATLMLTLAMSYFLIPAAPWFCCWLPLSVTRGFTLGFARTVFGTMNALFATVMMCAIMATVGTNLEASVRDTFMHPGVTLTTADYIVPLAVGFLLCLLVPSVPYVWARTVDGMVMNWNAGRGVMQAGSTVVHTATSAGQKAAQAVQGGGQQQVGSSGQSIGNSGGQRQGQTAPRNGNWGRRP